MDNQNKKEIIRFYFSFNDPYSFIIAPIVKNLAQNYKVDIEYFPVPGFDSYGLFSENTAVQNYYKTDVQRFAKKAGRELNFADQPQDSSNVCRGYFLAEEKMLGVKYINLLFAMRWLNGKDISRTDEVVEGLKFLEFDEAELKGALESDKYTERLEANKSQATEDNVAGVPFLSFRGEGFMGEERIEYLEERLKSDQDLIIHHDAGYLVISPEELEALIKDDKPHLILDIRIPKDFGEAHIPGSNCLPAKVVYRNLDRLEREWNIIMVDDGGVAASETAFMVAGAGFGKVSVLTGGFPAWKGPTESGMDKWQDKLKPKPAIKNT